MRILLFALLGAISGAVVAALWGPNVIHWYAQPPFPMGCDCGAAMTWAMERLVWTQALFTLAGAVLFPIFYRVFFRRRRVIVND